MEKQVSGVVLREGVLNENNREYSFDDMTLPEGPVPLKGPDRTEVGSIILEKNGHALIGIGQIHSPEMIHKIAGEASVNVKKPVFFFNPIGEGRVINSLVKNYRIHSVIMLEDHPDDGVKPVKYD